VSESHSSCRDYQVLVVMREFGLLCIVTMFWWIHMGVIWWTVWAHGKWICSSALLLLFILFYFEEHTFCVYKLNLHLSNSKFFMIGM
jgi:hypothetical protein